MQINKITESPSFVALAWSNLLAQSAEQIALAAAPLVAVLALGVGATETGALQALLTLPFLLFAIPAGLLADRISRSRLMLAAEAVRAVSLITVAWFIVVGQISMPLLAILGFVGVCSTVMFSVAAPAVVPSLVRPEALSQANARIELARTLAFTAGPALGGLFVGWIGSAGAFAIASLLSITAILFLSRVRESARGPSKPQTPVQDIKDGLAFAFRHNLLAPVFLTQIVFGTAFFMILAVFVPYAVHHLQLSAAAVGVTLAMYGLGMVVGALSAPRVMAAYTFGYVIAIGPFCGLAGASLILATIWVSVPLLAAAGFFLLGVGPILWVISTTTLRQSVTPQQLLGRVSAINVLAQGARPVGAGLGAIISATYGIETSLIVAVLGFALQLAIIVASPAVRLERQPTLAAA